ncbi:hypothetical protein QTH87_20295 [Variovorax sp. J22P168]|uniref:hypothetical protein n=1 Tax=Variovorax jilinensis TaxID=3053513 RepID=UPI002576E1A3|nr:hypothetical protein [Variovorax sp. J22P168]MDM0014796.1 hypothetical protein [Variovorax sp. J22P168]
MYAATFARRQASEELRQTIAAARLELEKAQQAGLKPDRDCNPEAEAIRQKRARRARALAHLATPARAWRAEAAIGQNVVRHRAERSERPAIEIDGRNRSCQRSLSLAPRLRATGTEKERRHAD